MSVFAERPTDVKGWDRIVFEKTTWSDVVAQHDVKKPPERKPEQITVDMPVVHVGNIIMWASASTGPDLKYIERVVLVDFPGNPERSAPSASGIADFAALEALLIEKYGHPSSEDSNFERGANSARWTFPSITIELEITHATETVSSGDVIITYRAVNKKALGAL